jgi:acyl carrier protein
MDEQQVKALIRREVANAAFREVGDAERLLDDRVLDSVGAVDLAVALEGVFGISIPFVDINPQHFGSVDDLARYIALKLK